MFPTAVDVIIVGSGAGGLTAAITAAHHGLSVLVLEKAEAIGGTTAWSGGGVWIPTNHLMEAAGEPDSPGQAQTYIQAVLGNHYDGGMARAFVRHAADAVRFLEAETPSVRFVSYAGSDYHPDLPGAARKARTLLPKPFDGRRLGPWLKRLRRPKPEMTVFNGMQIETTEVRDFQNILRSPAAFLRCLGLMARYGKDVVVHGRGTRMIRGTALAAAMLEAALDKGVDVRTGVIVRGLSCRGRQVAGVEVETVSGRITIGARRGVVLATGGISANPEFRPSLIPDATHHLQVLPRENTGDGAAYARDAGAVLGSDVGSNAIFAPASSRRLKSGETSVYPHFGFDRCKPGALIVGPDGRRFVNEGESYHTLVKRMHERGVSPAWLIGDHRFLRAYGMGMARAAPYPYKPFVRESYLIEADTLEALAGKIGVDPEGLVESAANMNRYAASGVDEEFGKGSDIYTRLLGDAEHGPNPSLGPIRTAPFYALALRPTDVGASLGIAINADGQALDASGVPIAGLYAAGLDAHAALRGYYPGAGTQIGQAIAFGYAAGQALSRA